MRLRRGAKENSSVLTEKIARRGEGERLADALGVVVIKSVCACAECG